MQKMMLVAARANDSFALVPQLAFKWNEGKVAGREVFIKDGHNLWRQALLHQPLLSVLQNDRLQHRLKDHLKALQQMKTERPWSNNN